MSDVLAREHLVKIDGFREPQHAAVAVAAGADLIGFIFAPARRRVPPAAAAACITAAREANPAQMAATVGVFVDAAAAEINAVVGHCGLDFVQLHGGEPPDLLEEIAVPAIKVFRPEPGTSPAAVLSRLERYLRAPKPPAAFLVDGFARGASGGTGTRADWGLAAEIAAKFPIILGGGLDAQNVGDAIRLVRPRGVDVSSGVEVAGVKDVGRIQAFILAARSAFHTAGGAPG